MLITLAKIQSPIMKAYLTVRTRPADHDGIPHVLEHLIFMGSEEYPYKGILDKVANRCFAQGTNAYTQNTNTTYELTTAGKEGFYRLLPVYLDHILYPTLSDNAFITEIHHIDGSGQNSGVVYNEMLGRENAPDELIYMVFNELMFDKSEGYQYNFGGRVSNLRELTIEKVRQFHKEYYCPQNFNVIVVGNTSVEELIDSVNDSIEQKVLNREPTINPQLDLNIWKQSLPKLTSSISKDIVYPSDEEDSGFYVTIGWRATPWKDFATSYALDIVWSALTSGDIAPIRKEFIENESGDVWCGDVYASVDRTFENTHKICFINVEPDRYDTIVEKFYDFMRNVKIDLEYFKLVINRDRLDSLRSYETSPHETFSSVLIEDFLYSTDNQDCRQVLDVDLISEELAKKDEQFWKDLIEKYILSTENVVLRATPSAQKAKDMADENTKRIEEQKTRLGEAKLKELETRLKQAEEANTKPIDEKFLKEKFPIPTLDSIEEIHIATYRNDNNPSFVQTPYDKVLAEKLKDHISPLPFFLQITSIASRFVEMFCLMDSSNVPLDLKMYIPLFLALNFSCDMKLGEDPSQYIKKENVIMSLMRESVSNSYTCGGDNDSGDGVHKGITDYLNYHDRHSLSVAINFLTGEEGPFWVKLRGKGLCYGYSIISNVDKGSVGLYLSRVGNVSKAYAESKAIIEAVCSDEEPSENVLKLNESALEPAKATTVVEKLNNAETIISAAYSRFLTNTLFNGPRNFYENLQDIGKVTVSDVKRVIKQYLLPLFLENEGALFICDNAGKISNEYPIKDDLEKIGYLKTYSSLKEYLATELGVTVSAPKSDMSCDEITEGAEDDEGEDEEEEGEDSDSMEDDE
ncbi:predicted protein [Naegleria gruberi]|uniref:Predicted protein n=1 Tax=Naegleria gruberi TaxID=5762 RepID=D2VHJ0_NAEGR|nr:uncharacterized protein NAEGRDRAFT_49592 [Naegleria gruberi]EFC43690.1 predicted protein [Naegleria gruberi]|eukprot:XP_002676434.1 predicted protein [Naegleria gruberi strain NEG-M]